MSQVQVEIISKQNVKPSTPTPPHLKIFHLSLLDQLNPHLYPSSLHFYANHCLTDYDDIEAVAMERSQVLKNSLSRTLSHFYPLAGELSHDFLRIDCNDNGVYYVEARVRDRLSDFLTHPKQTEIHKLLPFHPNSPQLASMTCLLMIQVNIFDCGAIALGIYTSHKFVDGHSASIFLNAWAAQARGPSAAKQIYPDLYTAPSVFVQDPTLLEAAGVRSSNRDDFKKRKLGWTASTRRFVFNATDLAALKAKTGACSRVLAVIGLIWKCAVSASGRRLGCQKPSNLAMSVNLRSRITSEPPMSAYSVGNIYCFAFAHATAGCLKLDTAVGSLRDGLAQLERELPAKFMTAGEKGGSGANGSSSILNELNKNFDKGADNFVVTSLCNGGFGEADFGWGKQVWSALGYTNSDTRVLENPTSVFYLMDTRSDIGGIEAWVILPEPNMKILEKDPEILAFASLDPSPLLYIGK